MRGGRTRGGRAGNGRFAAALVIAGMAAAACTPSTGEDTVARSVGSLEVAFHAAPTARPADGSVIRQPATDPAALSLALSEARFENAAGVVVANDGNGTAARELVTRFGLPLLVLPAAATPEQVAGVADEVTRLGAHVVLHADGQVPDQVAQAAAANRQGPVRKLAAASGELQPWLGVVADEATAGAVGPFVEQAGGQILVAPEVRTSGEAISALAAAPETPVIGIGAGLPDEPNFVWQVGTARTGYFLPGADNQVATLDRLYVAIYGHPGAPVLGVLGEQGVAATIQRSKDHAAEYKGLTDLNLVPTLEIITTVASASAGADGDYSAESSPEHIRPLIEAAGAAGVYVILDLQPGRTDFLTQAKMYEEFLRLPYVGLALDPEWRLLPHQVHLVQIGRVQADEVNSVVSWLADLTRDNNLPQKILVLHSFRTYMVEDIDKVDTSRPEIAVTMHVDGQGAQGAKVNTWNVLRNYATNIQYWGWKNFYDEDTPRMLTPEETIATVKPTPLLISYQ